MKAISMKEALELARRLMATNNGDCYKVHADAIVCGIDGLLCHGTVWHPEVGWHGHC